MYRCKDAKCPSKKTCYRFAVPLPEGDRYAGFHHHRDEKQCGNFKEIPKVS